MNFYPWVTEYVTAQTHNDYKLQAILVKKNLMILSELVCGTWGQGTVEGEALFVRHME